MDIRTGQTYDTKDAALADGVPESDIAEVSDGEVRFSSGPFKGRTYRRTRHGLVRIDQPAPGRGMFLKHGDKGELVQVKA